MGETIILNHITYPLFYESTYILTYPGFNEEMKEIIEESGYKQKVIRNYRKKLVFLDGLKRNCTQQKSFERLKNTNLEMYSIRILGDLNVRILFTFKSINKIEHAILLCVFLEKEKGNKVNSKDGYKVNIKIAEDRSKEIN